MCSFDFRASEPPADITEQNFWSIWGNILRDYFESFWPTPWEGIRNCAYIGYHVHVTERVAVVVLLCEFAVMKTESVCRLSNENRPFLFVRSPFILRWDSIVYVLLANARIRSYTHTNARPVKNAALCIDLFFIRYLFGICYANLPLKKNAWDWRIAWLSTRWREWSNRRMQQTMIAKIAKIIE